MRKALIAILALASAAAAPPPAPLPPPENQKLAHDILRDLVAIRAVHDTGTAATAKVIAAYFRKGGFAQSDIVSVADPRYPRQVNVVVRLRGSGKQKPVLWLQHMDVVDARAQDWSLPPFHLTEKDGWFYGRGTTDMKDGNASVAAALIRLKQEGFRPSRDIIAAFTADEEVGTDQDGPDYLVRHRRDLVDAAFVINTDGASGEIDNGRRLDFGVQTAEKIYVTWHMDVTNKGGHSSEPRPDNAIYQLSNALVRLQRFSFPLTLNETTRTYFRQMAQLQSGQKKADMLATANGDLAAAQRLTADTNFNALLHTTCVATMLSAGVQENALPSSAQATVQCRMMPSETAQGLQATLTRVIADPQVRLTRIGALNVAPASAIDPNVFGPVTKVAAAMWPGVPVIPSMAAGASDSIFTRAAGIPSYGVGGTWDDIDDVRAHGRDERRWAADFYSEAEFTYRLMTEFGR